MSTRAEQRSMPQWPNELGKAVGGMTAFVAAYLELAERVKAQEELTAKLERQHEILMAALGSPSVSPVAQQTEMKE